MTYMRTDSTIVGCFVRDFLCARLKVWVAMDRIEFEFCVLPKLTIR